MTPEQTNKCWHLVVTTEGGTVSILQNLDADTARRTYEHLMPHRVVFNDRNFGCSIVSESDIKRVAILGPEGMSLFDQSPAEEPVA